MGLFATVVVGSCVVLFVFIFIAYFSANGLLHIIRTTMKESARTLMSAVRRCCTAIVRRPVLAEEDDEVVPPDLLRLRDDAGRRGDGGAHASKVASSSNIIEMATRSTPQRESGDDTRGAAVFERLRARQRQLQLRKQSSQSQVSPIFFSVIA